jgi:hypothetical protein
MEICPKAEAAGEINPVAGQIITGLAHNVGKNSGSRYMPLEEALKSITYKVIVKAY